MYNLSMFQLIKFKLIEARLWMRYRPFLTLPASPFSLSNMFESSVGRSVNSRRISLDDASIFRKTVMQMHSMHKQNLAVMAINSLPQMSSIVNGMQSVISNNTRVLESTVTRLEAVILSSSTSVVSDKSDQTKVLVDRVLKKLAAMNTLANGRDKKLTQVVSKSNLKTLVLEAIRSIGGNSPKMIILSILGRTV